MIVKKLRIGFFRLLLIPVIDQHENSKSIRSKTQKLHEIIFEGKRIAHLPDLFRQDGRFHETVKNLARKTAFSGD